MLTRAENRIDCGVSDFIQRWHEAGGPVVPGTFLWHPRVRNKRVRNPLAGDREVIIGLWAYQGTPTAAIVDCHLWLIFSLEARHQ